MNISSAPIECLQKDDTVYIRNLKCASTFFYENFKKAGWQPIEFISIDWQKCHVFGHILDPIVRRHKGIAEYIKMCDLEDEYINNKKLQKLIKACPYLDRHSIPYHILFNDKLYAIDWIPISNITEKNVKLTEKLLAYKNIKIPNWDYKFSHASDRRIENIVAATFKFYNAKDYEEFAWKDWYRSRYVKGWPEFTKFELLPDSVKRELEVMHSNEFFKVVNGQIQFSITTVPSDLISKEEYDLWAPDINLYNAVSRDFNPSGNMWQEISWLKYNG